ncbi:MAG TPA: ricin-type beta-trefoil lectin domain protein [Rugosimonospora sp.]|nr:ricin-type beta-trefoil lectin domain protein [Rugosimonospora sp.]
MRLRHVYRAGLVLVVVLATFVGIRSFGAPATGTSAGPGGQDAGTGLAAPPVPDGVAAPSLYLPPTATVSAPAASTPSASVRAARQPAPKTQPPRTPAASSPAAKVPGLLDGSGVLYGLNGQCLDNNSSVTDNGNPIQLWECDQTSAQVWTVASGQFMVQGKCLTVSGTAGVLWACDGSATQRWQAGADGTVRNPMTGRCLTAPDTFTKVTVTACTGATGQKWHR